MIEFKMQGFAELERALRDMPDKVAKRCMALPTLRGAQLVQKAAIATAPIAKEPHRVGRKYGTKKGKRTGVVANVPLVQPGNLRRNIVVRRKRGSDASEMVYQVGITGKAFYGMFVEFGTVKMPARPFLRPALDENYQQVLDIMRDLLALKVERELRRK